MMLPSNEELERVWINFKLRKNGYNSSKKYAFVSFPDITMPDSLREHIYAFRFKDSDKRPVFEYCMRRDEDGETYMNNRIVFNYMNGYSYMFGGTYNGKSSLIPTGPYSGELVRTECKWSPNLWTNPQINLELTAKKLQKLDVFKYIDSKRFLENQGCDWIFSILNIRRHTHECEMMIKNGMGSQINDKRWYGSNAMKVLKKCKEIGTASYTVGSFDLSRNLDWDDDMFRDFCSAKRIYSRTANETLIPSEFVEIKKYLSKQDCYGFETYSEFISHRKKLNLSLASHSSRFPSNLEKADRLLVKRIDYESKVGERKKKQKLARNLRKNALKASAILGTSKGEYGFFVPSTTGMFKSIGKSLNNCVGSYDYDEKMAKGENLIVCITKKSKRWACLEVQNGKVKQLYLKDDMTADDSTKKFVNTFIVPRLSGYWKRSYASL